MSKYEQIQGLALLNDVEAQPAGFLTGGMNMVKRGKVGMVRRPEYSPLDAVTGPATSPKGAFPLEYYGQEGDIMALANGVLYKADRSDSYDQVTKSVTDARPTHAFLGEWGLFATGGRVLKYDGDKTPHPVGSKLIADMEADESWSTAGAGTPTDDTDNELTGTQCKKGNLTVGQGITWTAEMREINIGNSKAGSFGPTIGRASTTTIDRAIILQNSSGATVTISAVKFVIFSVTGTVVGDIEMRIQRVTPGGIPDGTDLDSGTLLNADITGGTKVVEMDDGTKTIIDDEKVAIIWDIPNQSSDGIYVTLNYGDKGTGYQRGDTDGAGGSWISPSTFHPPQVGILGGTIDLYTNYPDNSTIKLNMFMDDTDNFDTGADSYIKFIVEAGVTEAEYQFTSGDLSTSYREISLIRGANADDAGKGNSDFTITGTMDWSAIKTVEIKITSQTGTLNVYLDYMFLLHLNAPPSSDKVFVSNESIWVLSGNEARYSSRAADVWWSDTLNVFPSNCLAVSEGRGATLIHNEKGTWASPRITSGFPDFDFVQISPFGTTSKHGAGTMKYKGQEGAFWVSQTGAHFWAGGINSDVIISTEIQAAFDGSGATDVKAIDWSRGDEIICLFHPRYEELWMFIPHSDDTDGLIYAYVLDASTGRWNTMFKWFGSEPIVFASIIRDSGVHKLLLTDNGGGIHAEAEGGTSPESSVLSYADSWFMGPINDEETEMHEAMIKFRPRTTGAFNLEIRKRVAEKEDEADSGGEVDYSTYDAHEAQVVYPDAFVASGMDRTVTAPDVDSLYVKKISIPDDVSGHALSLRIGVLSGGTDEWELTGFRLTGAGEDGF